MIRSTPLLSAALLAAGCGGGVNSDEEAELAYRGLDVAIAKAMDLGFEAFNAADSANIDATSTEGDVSGTLTITGQIDQGSSDNKGMRLDVSLVDYQDLVDVDDDSDEDVSITYDTVDGDSPE